MRGFSRLVHLSETLPDEVAACFVLCIQRSPLQNIIIIQTIHMTVTIETDL